MKKHVLLILCTSLMAGCTARESSVNTSVVETAEPQKESCWVKEPAFAFKNVRDLHEDTNVYLKLNTETFGEIWVTADYEVDGYAGDLLGYTSDAVIVEEGSEQGIYDYSGREIQPLTYNSVQTPGRVGITTGIADDKNVFALENSASSSAVVFSTDFTSVSEVQNYTGDPIGYDTSAPYLAVQNGVFGVVGMKRDSSGNRKGWVFEALDSQILDNRAVVISVNDNCDQQAYVIYDPSDQSVTSMSSSSLYRNNTFANGYYIISESSHATLVEAASGAGVAVDYQDMKYMSDGYAPAKINGRWGFVDTSGNEVTDFIFDDATPLYDGKSYVRFNNLYGIIDIKSLLEQGKQINISTVSSYISEEIGSVTVNVSQLLIHDTPGAGTDVTGTCMEGSEYPVYEKTEADSYTWYRISDNDWIADEGTWCTYTENKGA